MRRFAVAAALLCICGPSIAAYTLQLTETGGNVVGVGSGSLNTDSLSVVFSGGYNAFLIPNGAAAIVGPAGGTNIDAWGPISGPAIVGPGNAQVLADTGGGDKAGVVGTGGLVVAQGYVSGAPMAASSTWNAATFASLGLTPGEYVWTWGTGATADSFTLRIGLMQTITFTSTAPVGALVGGATYTVAATGGASGNPVVFTIDPAAAGVCSIAGTAVSFSGPGTCMINANQVGGSGYAPAPQAQQSFNVAALPLPAASIPTLSEWGLICISTVMAMLGISRMRRRKSVPL